MLGLVRNNLILEFFWPLLGLSAFSFVFPCSKLSLSQGHLCMLRNWGYWCGSWAIIKPLPLRRMIPFWEIGLLSVAACARERREWIPVSTAILSRSKGIMVVRSLGKNQWQLTDKIRGSVRWQCLKRSRELLHSEVCGVDGAFRQPMPAYWGFKHSGQSSLRLTYSHSVYSSGHCGHSKVGWPLVAKERQLGVQVSKITLRDFIP